MCFRILKHKIQKSVFAARIQHIGNDFQSDDGGFHILPKTDIQFSVTIPIGMWTITIISQNHNIIALSPHHVQFSLFHSRIGSQRTLLPLLFDGFSIEIETVKTNQISAIFTNAGMKKTTASITCAPTFVTTAKNWDISSDFYIMTTEMKNDSHHSRKLNIIIPDIFLFYFHILLILVKHIDEPN